MSENEGMTHFYGDDCPGGHYEDERIACICAEWDGRGRSVCGVECPLHPINGKCPGCEKPIHGSQQCLDCFVKESDKLRPGSVDAFRKAYHHLIESFHALERWQRIEDKDKSPKVDREEIAAQIKTLRAVWQSVIDSSRLEEEYHQWYRDWV